MVAGGGSNTRNGAKNQDLGYDDTETEDNREKCRDTPDPKIPREFSQNTRVKNYDRPSANGRTDKRPMGSGARIQFLAPKWDLLAHPGKVDPTILSTETDGN